MSSSDDSSSEEKIPDPDRRLLQAQRRAEDALRKRRGEPPLHELEAEKHPEPISPATPVLFERMYPFTKGMNLINDGVAYGERVREDVAVLKPGNVLHTSEVVTVRTRTGKLNTTSSTKKKPTGRVDLARSSKAKRSQPKRRKS